MSAATVTSKGQITIPVDIRQAMNIHTGDVLEFFIESNGKLEVFPRSKDVQGLKELLPKTNKTVSIEEMNSIINKRGIGDD